MAFVQKNVDVPYSLPRETLLPIIAFTHEKLYALYIIILFFLLVNFAKYNVVSSLWKENLRVSGEKALSELFVQWSEMTRVKGHRLQKMIRFSILYAGKSDSPFSFHTFFSFIWDCIHIYDDQSHGFDAWIEFDTKLFIFFQILLSQSFENL